MRQILRIGAVSYLNTKPLIWGLEHDAADRGLELSLDVPAVLARRMAAGELDVALLPVIELGRIGPATNWESPWAIATHRRTPLSVAPSEDPQNPPAAAPRSSSVCPCAGE